MTRLTGRGVESPSGTVVARTVAVLTDRCLPALGLAAAAVYHVQTFLADFAAAARRRHPGHLSGDRLMVWDTDLVYQYYRITGDGRLLLGGADLGSMYARRESPFEPRASRARCTDTWASTSRPSRSSSSISGRASSASARTSRRSSGGTTPCPRRLFRRCRRRTSLGGGARRVPRREDHGTPR